MNSTILDYSCVLKNCTNVTECFYSCSNIITTEVTTEQIATTAKYYSFMINARFVVQRVCMPVIYVLGIIGNVLSVIVLTQRRMRSSTNNYLTALATFDMLFLLLNFSLSLVHYPGYKPIVAQWYPMGVLLTDTSSNTSVWLTVSFTVERYIAVCHPMIGKRMCTRSRANIVIAAVFIVCFALTLPVFFEWAIVTVEDPKTNTSYYDFIHQDIAENPIITKLLYWYSAIIFIIVPLCALSVFNLFLIYSVHKSRSQRQQMTMCTRTTKEPSSQETKITIMLIGVVIVFMLCQLPAAGHLIYSSSFANQDDAAEMNFLRGLGNIFNMLTAINASVNFLLYCCLSKKFRHTFVHTLCPWYRRAESPEHSLSNSMYTQIRDPESGLLKREFSKTRTQSISIPQCIQVSDLNEEKKKKVNPVSCCHCQKRKHISTSQLNYSETNKETISLNPTDVANTSDKSYSTFTKKILPINIKKIKVETSGRKTETDKVNVSKIQFALPETTVKQLKRKKREKKKKKINHSKEKNNQNFEIEIEEKVTSL